MTCIHCGKAIVTDGLNKDDFYTCAWCIKHGELWNTELSKDGCILTEKDIDQKYKDLSYLLADK